MLWTVVLEKTLESPLDCKEIQPVHSEGDQPWDFFGRNDAKALTPVLWPPHVKSWLGGKDWCLEGLGAGGEGDDRGWDGWMASLTQWTWVWVNSRRWWWTGRPGMLQFMGSQRVRHDWDTELNWIKPFSQVVYFSWWSLHLYLLKLKIRIQFWAGFLHYWYAGTEVFCCDCGILSSIPGSIYWVPVLSLPKPH